VLLVGLVLVLVGISDIVIAAVIARREAAAASVPGAPPRSRYTGVLKRTGFITIGFGAVIALIGLLS
jgi:hypothetical protein